MPEPFDPAAGDEVAGGPSPAIAEWPPRPAIPPTLGERLAAARTRYGLTGVRILASAAALLLAAGLAWWLLRPAPAPVERTIPLAPSAAAAAVDSSATGAAGPAGSTTSPAAGSSTTVPTVLVAHAAGAVNRPGLYRLAAGARVDDLVRAAGGLGARADADRLNLAAPLADGQRLYVPEQGMAQPPPEVLPGGGAGSAGVGSTTGGAGAAAGAPPGSASAPSPASPLDLNSASAEQLDELPGVGPSTAAAILAYRQEHGRFRSVDELLDVRGIGDAKMAELRSLVTVGG